MAYKAATLVPTVAVFGSARVVDNVYKGDGSTTFVKGDLIRITTSGQVKKAAAANAGCVHGMVLETWTTAPTTSQYVSVLLFGADTILKMQLYSGVTYSDLSVGTRYTLSDGGSGKWSVTSTTTNGVMELVQYPTDDFPAGPANDLLANGCAYFRVPQAILDTVYAA